MAMDQMAVENCSNVSAKESLPDFGNQQFRKQQMLYLQVRSVWFGIEERIAV